MTRSTYRFTSLLFGGNLIFMLLVAAPGPAHAFTTIDPGTTDPKQYDFGVTPPPAVDTPKPIPTPFISQTSSAPAPAAVTSPVPTQSLGSGDQSSGVLTNPLQATDLPTLLKKILDYIVVIGTLVLTLMLIYVGFLFVAARGNAEKVSTARSALIWTIIGGLILLGSKVLADAIVSIATSL